MKVIKAEGKTFNYNIYTGEGIISKLPSLLKKQNLHENYFIVLDSKVNSLYGSKIKELFLDHGQKVKFLSFNFSEKSKTMEGTEKILNSLLKNNFSRDTLLIAIGGGITGDAAGFAASIYMRGIPYVHVPTTLLAAVDSSIGGKTGVNLSGVKNIVGSFYQPKMVVTDTEFFKTLPVDEIICGIGEIIKYAFLTENSFYNFVSKNIDNLSRLETKAINRVVSTSIKYKVDIVTEDEKESGLRKLLNLGHTFAHACEAVLDHKIKHGQAVILGITAANYLSNAVGLMEDKTLEQFLKLTDQFKNMITVPKFNPSEIYNMMHKDKKNKGGDIRFVLMQNIGETVVDVQVPKSFVIEAIEKAVLRFGKN